MPNPVPIPVPKRRILVIESDPDQRALIHRYISLSGYEAILLASGAEGFKWLAADKLDLILLAIALPEVDGVVILRQLHEKYEQLKVIMLAAPPDIPKAHQALNFGASDFISKPVDLPTVKRTLQVHLPPGK